MQIHQKAVSSQFTSKQILPFGFSEQYGPGPKDIIVIHICHLLACYQFHRPFVLKVYNICQDTVCHFFSFPFIEINDQ